MYEYVLQGIPEIYAIISGLTLMTDGKKCGQPTGLYFAN